MFAVGLPDSDNIPGEHQGLIMSTWTLAALRQKRDEIIATAARWGARDVRVFGSVARGDAQPTSDVDLLVEFEPGRSLLDHGGLLMDLQEILDCRVDVVTARAMRPRFRDRVEKDAVPL